MSVCSCRSKYIRTIRIALELTWIVHNGDLGAPRFLNESLHKYCVNTSEDEVELRTAMSNISNGVNRKRLEKKASKHLHM